MTQIHVSETVWTTRRFSIEVAASFEDFRARYEEAVPAYPIERFQRLVSRNAAWEEMLAVAAEEAPFGFMIYSKNEAHPLMRLAGDTALCVWYLMGNYTVAEQMFRHDPRVMIYAPLRTEITQDAGSVTRFTFDQPSTQFSSFRDPAIAAVGVELDHKVAALLSHLNVSVPQTLIGGA